MHVQQNWIKTLNTIWRPVKISTLLLYLTRFTARLINRVQFTAFTSSVYQYKQTWQVYRSIFPKPATLNAATNILNHINLHSIYSLQEALTQV